MGILERVWNPSAELHVESGTIPFVEMLERLLAVPLVVIYDTSQDARQETLAVIADHEVIPNASLADVLYEERGIAIAENAVVLFLPAVIASEAVTARLADVLRQLTAQTQRKQSQPPVLNEDLQSGFPAHIAESAEAQVKSFNPSRQQAQAV